VKTVISRVELFKFEGAASAEMIAEWVVKESLLCGAGTLESMVMYSTDLKSAHLSSIGI
jgi:hypothetical protein